MRLSKEAETLAEPTRLHMAALFRDNDRLYRNQIARLLDANEKSVKHHIDKMRGAGLIQDDGYEVKHFQRGSTVAVRYYRKTEKLGECLRELSQFTGSIQPVQKY